MLLKEKKKVNEVRLTFDPDLSEERCISVSKAFFEKEPIGVAKQLVKDFKVELLLDGKVVAEKTINGNYQRLRIVEIKGEADEVKVSVLSTNGDKDARFESIIDFKYFLLHVLKIFVISKTNMQNLSDLYNTTELEIKQLSLL